MTKLIKTAARVLSAALLTLPLLGGPTCAKAFKAGDIEVDHPWARATPGRAKNGAAYMKLKNHGDTDDRLTAVSSDVASRVELHTHLHDNGVMKMAESGPILVPAHGEAILQPGSLHVMMIGLTAPLMEGEMFPLTLTFEKSGPVTVNVMVKSVGAGAGSNTMKHDHHTKKN